MENDSEESGRILHVMGFKYSGSSAVIDALVDQAGAVGITGGYPDETALFTQGRPQSPLNFFRDHSDFVDGPGLLALITEGRVGLSESRFEKSIKTFIAVGVKKNRSVNFNNFPGLDLGSLSEFEDEIERSLVEIRRGSFSGYFELIRRMVERFANPWGLVVLNNDPPAHHYKGDNVVLGAKILSVGRDSRDIILDRRAAEATSSFRGTALSALRTPLEVYRLEKLFNSIELQGISIVSFERFVEVDSYRKAVLAKLGITYKGDQERRFVPGNSISNVRLFSHQLNWFWGLLWGVGIVLSSLRRLKIRVLSKT